MVGWAAIGALDNTILGLSVEGLALDNEFMCRLISMQEVEDTIKLMNVSKALGLDDLLYYFIATINVFL